ncbi:MAG: amidohydrolase [Ignavibacteriaceae bacterium]|nr:amidohydrolase [Ignavibacteriaceae bacterium]
MKYFFLLIIFSIMNITAQNLNIFINGKIYTLDPNQKWVEAVVVENGRIIYVGNTHEAMKYNSAGAILTDLEGKLTLPGFIDNHTHFINGGFYLNGIDLRGAKSTAEFKEIIRKYSQEHKNVWITGGDWDHEAWEVKDLPHKSWIDPFTANTPVFVSRFDGHMGLANSLALKLAGITKDTPSPEGGLIVKDPLTGEPTGMLKDNAMNLVFNVIPTPKDEEYVRAMESALNEAKRFGVTSVQDITYDKDLEIYQRFEKEGKLTCRIFTRLPINDYENLVNKRIKIGNGSELLRMGSLKAFADGSLGSSTAWFYDPYSQDPSTSGLPNDIVLDGRLEKWSIDADKNRLQISIHAIGDKANNYILNMYEKIKNENPVWDRRFRIEHAQHVNFEDIPRFREIGVIASAQPYHCIDDGVWAEKRIGAERIKYTYPFRSFLDAGVLLCFGSDWSVAPLNPIVGIYAAVTRRTLDDLNPEGWVPEQKISVEEAVKCYTLNNAYASFEENIKGSLEVGKLGDMVVLDQNIFEIDPINIRYVNAHMTILGGKIIYQK